MRKTRNEDVQEEFFPLTLESVRNLEFSRSLFVDSGEQNVDTPYTKNIPRTKNVDTK
jgi:hypothetical protein